MLLETDAEAVLEAARGGYGGAYADATGTLDEANDRGERPDRRGFGEPGNGPAAPRIRVRLVDGGSGGGRDRPIGSLPHRDRLVLRGPGVDAEADAARGVAEARVAAWVPNAPWFRESVLDHLTLFLVTRLDRTPLHAAAIVRDDVALLVAGPSGVGKSSAAYAAMRAGWRVISDDAVFVQLDPEPRLWCIPRPIHLPLEAARHFPELAAAEPVTRPDGRTKLVVPLPDDARVAVPWAGPTALCLLGAEEPVAPPDRSAPTGVAVRLGTDDAAAELRATLARGFHRFEHRLADCVHAVTTAGCWRVPRGGHPRDLLRRLDGLVASPG